MNNNDEQQFAYRVRQVLNEGSDSLAPRISARLQAARRRAVDASAGRMTLIRLSLVGNTDWTEGARVGVRTLVMALALSFGAISTYYWHQFNEAAENAELDSALLADDLPPDAYMDTGFKIWLERVSDASPQ